MAATARFWSLIGFLAVTVVAAVSVVVAAQAPAPDPPERSERRERMWLDGRGSRLGVMVQDLDAADKSSGVRIDSVDSDSPAAKAGIRAGDVVVEYDGERVRSARQFARLVDETPEGRSVKLGAIRDGQRMAVDIVPESRSHGAAWLSDQVYDRLEDLRMDMPEIKVAVPDFELKAFGRSGRLGVRIQTLTPQLASYFGAARGALVTEVDEGSPAAKAGIKAGDVITSIDGRTVEDAADLQRALRRTEEGAEVSIEILRDRKPMTIKAKPESPYERRSTRRRITDI
jgi:serine protease Do